MNEIIDVNESWIERVDKLRNGTVNDIEQLLLEYDTLPEDPELDPETAMLQERLHALHNELTVEWSRMAEYPEHW